MDNRHEGNVDVVFDGGPFSDDPFVLEFPEDIYLKLKSSGAFKEKKDPLKLSFKEFRAKWKHRLKRSEDYARRMNLFKEIKDE